ncbi:Double-stranded RNA-binding protein 2 [Bienertia sinuspersici]
MYKNQLQELAQRSCFNLPSYACVREGPDHAPRFKASVNFNGEIFESPAFFSTLRQAEHAAAEVALNTLADRGPSKTLAAKVLDETGVYKNLLQETAHRAGLNLPAYTTIRSGPGHVPVFLCTVELARMTFTGEPAKTKKQAQKNAAMAAWSALKQSVTLVAIAFAALEHNGWIWLWIKIHELNYPGIAYAVSQHSPSSSATTSGTHEEQEQVVVARFLASLNPAQSSNILQNAQLKGHLRSPASTTACRNPFSPTPTSFGIHYQNWAFPNLSPEIASHHMWLQEHAAEQQSRLMALPVPIPPVLPPSQALPWMHSMLRRTHHPLSPAPAISVYSPFYFSNHIVPDAIKPRPMVTIQEIHDENPEDSSNMSTLVPSKASVVSSSKSSGLVSSDKLQQQHEAKQECLSETQEKGSTGFVASRLPDIRLGHAATSNYCGKIGTALPTASPSVPVGPTQPNIRTPITAPRMQSGPGSFPVRPRFGRMQSRGFRSSFTAPAVQIRSVIPVCSAAPPRRTPSSTQGEESRDDSKSKNSSDVSSVNSKLGNLDI